MSNNLFVFTTTALTDWLDDWMKTSVNCSKCQTSSVIEGCVQEMLDPSLATSCCTQTSTETHRRVLGPPALMLLPASLLMTSALSAAPSSTWAPTSGLVCLVLLTTVGLVLAAESCCERRASRACFVKSNWQFAITPPSPLPHPSTPPLKLLPQTGSLFKKHFSCKPTVFSSVAIFFAVFSLFRYGSFRFCNVAVWNWLPQWLLIGRGTKRTFEIW